MNTYTEQLKAADNYYCFDEQCNNVTLGTESSQSGGHVTTIIQNFTLVSLTSSVMPHPIGLPLIATVPSPPRHSSSYAHIFLHTCLPTHLFPYALVLPLRLCTSRKNIPLRYPSEIVHLSGNVVCHPQLLQYAVTKLSCQLDAIDALLLYSSQPYHQYWPE